jgi:hypothetical protein
MLLAEAVVALRVAGAEGAVPEEVSVVADLDEDTGPSPTVLLNALTQK